MSIEAPEGGVEQEAELKRIVEDYLDRMDRSADPDEFFSETGESKETLTVTLRAAWDQYQDDPELSDKIRDLDRVLLGGQICGDADDLDDDGFLSGEMEDE